MASLRIKLNLFGHEFEIGLNSYYDGPEPKPSKQEKKPFGFGIIDKQENSEE